MKAAHVWVFEDLSRWADGALDRRAEEPFGMIKGKTIFGAKGEKGYVALDV